jgi:hypothetical protein
MKLSWKHELHVVSRTTSGDPDDSLLFCLSSFPVDGQPFSLIPKTKNSIVVILLYACSRRYSESPKPTEAGKV